jgi:hypothetical protein
LPELIVAGIDGYADHPNCRPPELKGATPSVHLRESYGYRANRR